MRISNTYTNLFFSYPTKSNLCHQCSVRLYSRRKVQVLQNYYERNFCHKNGLFSYKLRYYTSQVDAQKKNDQLQNVKDKTHLEEAKKINVKLKTSEIKRLFGLAEPEKWTLAGTLNYSPTFVSKEKFKLFSILF